MVVACYGQAVAHRRANEGEAVACKLQGGPAWRARLFHAVALLLT